MHNFGLFNQIKYDPQKEDDDHQKFIDSLKESQDLVQEQYND